MTIRIGINPITWSNDDLPELGGDTPLETCLAEARQAGYAGMELGNKFPRAAGELRAVMDRFGLAVVSGWYSARLTERSVDEEFAAMTPHLELLKAAGCKVMVFAETAWSIAGDRGRPLSTRARFSFGWWSPYLRRLDDLARRMHAHGMAMSYHPHMGTPIESWADIFTLMAGTSDAVGLLLDTGHLAFAGIDPLDVIERHGRRINHVHCKDVRAATLVRAKLRDDSFLDAVVDGVFTVPGDGMLDFDAVLGALHRQRYDGWLVVEAEQDPAKAPPLACAAMGHRNLTEAARRAGLI